MSAPVQLQPLRGTEEEKKAYCECGCGNVTKQSNRSDPQRGFKKGDYQRFLIGHSGGPKIGHLNWNTGKTWFRKDQEWSEAQIETRRNNFKIYKYTPPLGKKHTFESRKKVSMAHQGKDDANWLGFVSSENELIRKSVEYKHWRISVFERDNYTCINCEQKGGRLNVDHIKPFSKYPELRFAIDNGRTLCADCHRKTETWGFKQKWQLQ